MHETQARQGVRRGAAVLLAMVLALSLGWQRTWADEERQLIPVGKAVGIKLFADGVLVVSVSPVQGTEETRSPAKECGLKEGDILLTFNGEKIRSTEHLQAMLAENGETAAELTVQRDGKTLEVTASPVVCEDGGIRLGAWIRDSMAGIGTVTYYDPADGKTKNLVGMDPMDIRKSGIAMSFVPEDRLGMGLVGSMGMTGNMMLRSWRKGHGVFLNRKDPEDLAQRIWQELEVVTPSTSFPVRRMSGGNVQKVLVGREIATAPSVLMTAYAVRGLDINTSYTIYNLLTKEKMQGSAVIYVGEDLDVLLELCDRILVLCGGKVSGIVDGRTTTKEEVGLLMTRVGGKEKAAHE